MTKPAATDTRTVEDVIDQAQAPLDAQALALRHPATPTTIGDLSTRSDAIGIIERRTQTIAVMRRQAIGLTFPTDYVAYKAPAEQGGQVVCYLDDAGCDRVRDVSGIEVFDVEDPVRVEGGEPGVFFYVQRASGRCKLTGQTVERMEGGRASTDDFTSGVSGPALDLLVRKACRANLDGNITRELAGLKSIPLDELATVWSGTSRRVDDVRRGRGFGSRSERLGAVSDKAPDVPPPTCPVCRTPGVYRPAKGDRAAFYGCATWDKHKSQKFIINADQWVAKHKAATAAAPQPDAPPAPDGPPLTAEDIPFNREPGSEG